MNWFGEPWPSEHYRAPICARDSNRVPTPIGERCIWCGEEFDADSRGETTTAIVKDPDGNFVGRLAYSHVECSFRQVMGGPAHVRGTCSCQGGADDPDLGMSPRDAALWVWEHYQTGS